MSSHYLQNDPDAPPTLLIRDPLARSPSEYKHFLDAIPKHLLASASYGCRAYTRALKYLELYLREQREKYHREQITNTVQQAQVWTLIAHDAYVDCCYVMSCHGMPC